MQYYVVVDGTGKRLGLYCDAISLPIPSGAIPITPDQWQQLTVNGGIGRRFVNGAVVVDDPTPLAPPAPPT